MVAPLRLIGARERATPADLGAFVPSPRSRMFVVGATGTGKSTLAGALLDTYAQKHPTHRIYLIDSKGRYKPVFDEENEHLFPWGYRERNFGRRDQVPVQARLLSHARAFRGRDETAFIVPLGAADDLFAWLYDHADVRRPSLVYIDESVDFMKAVRASGELRRLIQQGRELGVGLVIVHQRPAWVDQTFYSESQAIIAGSLYHPRDLDTVRDLCRKSSLRAALRQPLPGRTWAYLDQHRPERSQLFRFTLQQTGA